MCENCNTSMSDQRQLDYLRRYLTEQEKKLTQAPYDAELANEIQRARNLIHHMEGVFTSDGVSV